VIEAAAIGVAAGFLSGLLGVGGGILFVPGLVFIVGLSQVDAEATSLLAIIPVALVGAWRQRSYGNVRLADGLLIGALSAIGAVAGVVVANALSAHSLRIAFALLTLFVAMQLIRRAMGADPG
jgi:uncharacterized membrane protein YfcA